MQTFKFRVQVSLRAASIHLSLSCVTALIAAVIVFALWYPFPYRELAGGRELFFLIVVVDIICGPLLTAVLYNPAKPRLELWRDLTIVSLIQLGALLYGMNIMWQVRPLFLVQEIDRFKVVQATSLNINALNLLPDNLKPHLMSGPVVVAIREPKNAAEREKVMIESVQGGSDYAERPEFYLPYDAANALKSLKRAKPLAFFLQKQPAQLAAATELAKQKNADIAQWMYLPVVARQDWVAVLDKQGQIQGFLKGDGF
jgi:hypothetical protein